MHITAVVVKELVLQAFSFRGLSASALSESKYENIVNMGTDDYEVFVITPSDFFILFSNFGMPVLFMERFENINGEKQIGKDDPYMNQKSIAWVFKNQRKRLKHNFLKGVSKNSARERSSLSKETFYLIENDHS